MGKRKVYTKYDPEQEYRTQLYASREEEKGIREELKQETELRLEKALQSGSVRCLYATNTYRDVNVKTQDTIITAQIYPAFHHKQDMPPQQQRQSREKRREVMRNLNDKRARRELTRLININFAKGDLWITLGYDDEYLPDSMKKALKDVENWIRRVNYRRKKRGLDRAKYIYITEWEDDEKKGKVRCHHHIIMDGELDRDTVEQAWGLCKRPNSRKLVPDEAGFTGLANYISKDPRGTKRWKASRNLKRPEQPTRSLSKFSKRNVNHMARDHEYMKMLLESKYPGYAFLDCEMYYNERQALFYIYARLHREGGAENDKKRNHNRTQSDAADKGKDRGTGAEASRAGTVCQHY